MENIVNSAISGDTANKKNLLVIVLIVLVLGIVLGSLLDRVLPDSISNWKRGHNAGLSDGKQMITDKVRANFASNNVIMNHEQYAQYQGVINSISNESIKVTVEAFDPVDGNTFKTIDFSLASNTKVWAIVKTNNKSGNAETMKQLAFKDLIVGSRVAVIGSKDSENAKSHALGIEVKNYQAPVNSVSTSSINNTKKK